jgi:hypothetical protein
LEGIGFDIMPHHKTPSGIIRSIKECIDQGRGIVPLIGSGMSAASGIPAGQDYKAYLFYCLARVFGTDGTNRKRKDNKKGPTRWDPSTLRWPDYSEVPVYDDIKKTMLQWSIATINKIAEDHYDEAEWEAIGAVADWRAMLDLLSRLSLQGDKDKKGSPIRTKTVVLKNPDHSIIDSFFVNLTKGKQPNSSHLLLAHLADILRLKIILTTNFDNLIENAFQTFVNPVTVFDVHMDASLPDADFVRAQRSVVKMHGGRYGLRADFSLDKYPTNDDVEKFVAYLSFYRNKNYPPLIDNERNLLVMGISPETKRIIALICRAMTKLKNLEVYWICHSDKDAGRTRREFEQVFKGLVRSGESNIKDKKEIRKYLGTHLLTTPVSDLSLFLLELYQTIFLSLPPAGVQFPSVWLFPPKPPKNEMVYPETEEKVEELKRDITGKNKKGYTIHREAPLGLIASKVFYELSSEYHCIWINLERPFNEIDLVFTLIESIARKTGLQNIVPAYSNSHGKTKIPKEMIMQFDRVLKYSKLKLVIFIDTRDISKNQNDCLHKIEDTLRSLRRSHITYILLGKPKKTTPTPVENEQDVAKKILDRKYQMEICNSIKSKLDDRNVPRYGVDIKDFYRFVLSLTLVQHTSYLSLLHSRAFIKAPYPLSIAHTIDEDNDKRRFDLADVFLDILRERNAIRYDEGHFVFMPRPIREAISTRLRSTSLKKDLSRIEAECHQGIADWYMKLYRASGDMQAVIDSLHHRLQCFQSAVKIKDVDDKFRFMFTSLVETELAIKFARNTVFSSHTIMPTHSFEDIDKEIKKCEEDCGSVGPKANIEWRISKLRNISAGLKDIRNKYDCCIGLIGVKGSNSAGNANCREENEHLLNSIRGCEELKYSKSKGNDDLEEAIRRIHTRNHVDADTLFNSMFGEIKFPIHKLRNEKGPDKIRRVVRKWVVKILNKAQKNLHPKEEPKYKLDSALNISQDLFKFIVKVFRRYQTLELYRAQIKRFASKNGGQGNLKNAEKIYIYATEIMRYITDNNFVNDENASLRSGTGIILSRMRRHREAYRRYNEAYGYLNFGGCPNEPLKYAIIDLSRGMTFLSQIEQKLYNSKASSAGTVPKESAKGLPTSLKRQIGMLYDAIASVDRGESRMKDNVDTWLQCWVLELQLNLCVEIVKLREEIHSEWKKKRPGLAYEKNDKYDLFGHCRECEFCGNRFMTNLEKGLEIAGNDVLRIARYFGLLFEYKKALPMYFHNKDFKKRINKACYFGKQRLDELLHPKDEKKTPKTKVSEEVKEYAEEVLQKLRKTGRRANKEHPSEIATVG